MRSILGGGGDTFNRQTLRNAVKSSVTKRSVTEMYNSIRLAQTQNVTNGHNVTQQAAIDLVSKVLVKNRAYNDLKARVEQTASQIIKKEDEGKSCDITFIFLCFVTNRSLWIAQGRGADRHHCRLDFCCDLPAPPADWRRWWFKFRPTTRRGI